MSNMIDFSTYILVTLIERAFDKNPKRIYNNPNFWNDSPILGLET